MSIVKRLAIDNNEVISDNYNSSKPIHYWI